MSFPPIDCTLSHQEREDRKNFIDANIVVWISRARDIIGRVSGVNIHNRKYFEMQGAANLVSNVLEGAIREILEGNICSRLTDVADEIASVSHDCALDLSRRESAKFPTNHIPRPFLSQHAN